MAEISSPLTKARILIADDDRDNAQMIEDSLRIDEHQVRYCPDGEVALHTVKSWSPHIVLLDINMPKLSGIECLKKIRALTGGEYIGVIMVTANSMLDQIIEGLDCGADDYIIKPFRVDELRARVRAVLRVKQLQDALRRANKRLEEVASRDELTSWYNMRFMSKRLAKEAENARKNEKPISCMMFDMDHFKQVNDTNDHLFGSFVLCEVAQLVQSHLRATDIPARYGGDEFLVAMPETTPKDAVVLANKIREAIQAHTFKTGNQSVKVTASFGIGGTEKPQEVPLFDARELIRLADAALYEAKNTGRNRVEFQDFTRRL